MTKSDRHFVIDSKLGALDPPTTVLDLIDMYGCERASAEIYKLVGVYITTNSLRNWRDASE